MIFAQPPPAPSPLRAAVRAAHLADEGECVQALLPLASVDTATGARIAERARALVVAVREKRRREGGLDAFMHEYDLSSEEGVVLMCLAEALLRIPDADTADRLIREKLARGKWDRHLGQSRSLLVNASTWGLMLTGRLVQLESFTADDIGALLGRLAARVGEPVIRLALMQAMRIMGHQFVMAPTIEEALTRARNPEHEPYLHSFDMLGEAAMTTADAERYYEAYAHAIDALGAAVEAHTSVHEAPGISVKLSALHPRFELAQRERVLAELTPRLLALAERAGAAGVGMTVDTEEADRLEPTLDVFEAVYERAPRDWEGFGLALQAYQKRAIHVLAWLIELARRHGRRIPVRLVKGAYWDSEIKRAQQHGLEGYPVFTRKAATDVCYLACAKRMWIARDAIYPQFATHNAHSAAFVLGLAGAERDFEFQRLHGMGSSLYAELLASESTPPRCRVYAPVGSHEELLPYLVRRLLENGANTSFVNRLVDEHAPVEEIIAEPVAHMHRVHPKPHPRIPLPIQIYGKERRAARGMSLGDPAALTALAEEMGRVGEGPWSAAALVGTKAVGGEPRALTDPSDRRRVVGMVQEAGPELVGDVLGAVHAGAAAWAGTEVETRAACLERAADLIEAKRAELMVLLVREGGKCIADALAEVREAVDFCRYYAVLARRLFAARRRLTGPTGERNELGLHGRGVFACISPWNFPLAIFVGQVAAALAAGNTVVAKPAEQTPLVAARAIRLLREAGVPADALTLLPGAGEGAGAALVADPRVAGVAFTGSTETAWAINRALAARRGPIATLIAETGGQNAMIVDSSALPEQVVADALASAFNSAGQRCSALRVLFVQRDVAPRLLPLLQGAMAELVIGDPALLSTDVGPVIDEQARAMLERHVARMRREARLLYQRELPPATRHGTYFAPCAFELDSLSQLEGEVFGPILHVICYAADKLDAVIDAINATGYGLTLGIHSRIDETIAYVQQRVRVGNTYVNRNMIGATVGVQPFGGEGLSGTGPKAGGPYYLYRFATERVLSVNTAAVGGNTALFAIGDDAG